MLLEIFYFASFLKPFLVARATDANLNMVTLRDGNDKNNADKLSLLEINLAYYNNYSIFYWKIRNYLTFAKQSWWANTCTLERFKA